MKNRQFASATLLIPSLVLMGLLFLVPIAALLSRSLFDPSLTFRHYLHIFAEPAYAKIFWISIEIAVVSTLICLAVGYPTAFFLSRSTGAMRSTLLGLILLPFWTNILVRCYAWIIILQTTGPINTVLRSFGIVDQPLQIVFNYTGVMIGMVHYLLPPAILILETSMKNVDQRLVMAAIGMGATPTQAFLRVFVPLSMPGVKAAALLLFVMGLGFFVTPALLGGRQELTVAMLVSNEFTETLNWGFGAAIAGSLLLAVLLPLYAYFRYVSTRSGAASHG
jgi:ABC-type spermidine/putrescine transport system permease subunit I